MKHIELKVMMITIIEKNQLKQIEIGNLLQTLERKQETIINKPYLGMYIAWEH